MALGTKVLGLTAFGFIALILSVAVVATAALQSSMVLVEAQLSGATNTTNATAANATAANATAIPNNATRIITNLTWNPGEEPDTTSGIAIGGEEIIQLSPENIQYQQTDPAFAKLAQTTADCLNHYNEISAKIKANPQYAENPGSGTAYTAEDINKQDLCTDVIRQGIDHFCESTDFATFDIAKCEEARNMSETYVGVVETLYG